MKVTARDLMSTELVTVKDTSTLEEALQILVNHRITGVPVVNERHQLIGILSEYDLLEQISVASKKKKVDLKSPIRFSKKIEAVSESTTLQNVVETIITSKFRRLPVLNKQKKLVGIITRRDLMRAFYYQIKLP